MILSGCVTLFNGNKFVGSTLEGFYEIKDRYYTGINLYFVSNKLIRVIQYERTGYSASYWRDYSYSLVENNIIIEAANDISVTLNGIINGTINEDEIILNNFKGELLETKLSIVEGDESIVLRKQNGNNRLKYTEWEGTHYMYNDLPYGPVDRKINLIFWLNNIVCLEIFQTVYYDDGWAVGVYLTPMFVNYSIKKNRIIFDINDTEITGIDNGLIYGELNNNEIILKNFNGNDEIILKKIQY
jgi:hypothetical protein